MEQSLLRTALTQCAYFMGVSAFSVCHLHILQNKIYSMPWARELAFVLVIVLWLLGCETGCCYGALAGQVLTMLPRVSLDLQQSSCLSLPSARMTDVAHYALLLQFK